MLERVSCCPSVDSYEGVPMRDAISDSDKEQFSVPQDASPCTDEEDVLIQMALLSEAYLRLIDRRPHYFSSLVCEYIAEINGHLCPKHISSDWSNGDYLQAIRLAAACNRVDRLEIERDSLDCELGDDPDHIRYIENQLREAERRVRYLETTSKL